MSWLTPRQVWREQSRGTKRVVLACWPAIIAANVWVLTDAHWWNWVVAACAVIMGGKVVRDFYIIAQLRIEHRAYMEQLRLKLLAKYGYGHHN